MESLLGVSVLELRTDNAPLTRGLTTARTATEAETRRMGTSWDQVGKRVATVGNHMSTLGSRMTTNVTLPIVAGAAGAIKVFSDFEGALTQVETQAGASRREIDNMRGALLNLAPAVGQTPVDLANALYHIESAGLRGAKALDVLTQSAKLAAIGHSNLEQTTNAVMAVLNNAPKDVKNATDAIGILNATVGEGNMRMGDLVAAFSTPLLQRAKAVGLGLKDVGAALDIMTKAGVPAQAAATRLSMTLSLMAAPNDKAAAALGSVGIKADQLALDMRKPDGLVVAVQDLKTHMDDAGLSAVKQNQLITQAFGGGRSSGSILALVQNVGDLQKHFDDIGKHSGAKQVADEWATTKKDVGFQWDQIKAEAEKTGIELGQAIGPSLISLAKDVAGDAASIAHAFSSLPASTQKAILTGGLVLAATGPALKLLGVFTTGVGRLYDVALIAGKLASGRGFDTSRTRGLVGSGSQSVASMEVAEMIVKSMVGGAAGSTWKTAGPAAVPAGATSRRADGSYVIGETAAEGTAAEAGGASVLSKAAGLGGRLLGAAGIAAIAAPVALGIGKLLGDIISSNSFGHKVSDSIFSHGFGGAQAPSLSKQTAAALDDLHQLTAGRKQLGTGQVGRFAAAVPINLDLSKLSLKDQDKVIAAAHKAGTLVARTLEAGWDQYKFQAEPVMFTQLRSKLKQLPPEAQASAVLSAVKFAEGLEKQGRLTQGSAARLLRGVESQFPGFEKYLGLSAGAGIQQFNKALNLNNAETNLKGQLQKMGQDFSIVQDAITKTNGTIQDKSAAAVKALLLIEQHGTGPARVQASKDLAALRQATHNDLSKMGDDMVGWMKQMNYQLGPNLLNASKKGAAHLADFASNVISNINSGAVGTGQGMNILIDNLNKALKEMGQKPLSQIQVGSLTLGIAKTKQLEARGAATGALVQFGRAGDGGRDSIPVRMGHQDVVVGSGEVGAVLTRHQFAGLNHRLAGEGGLPGYLARNNRPNYMAQGGMTESYGQLEGLWDQAGGPKNLAPIMAAIAEAESGGNTRAYNASGASGLWQILGLPFPGDPFDPLTNARMAVAKYRGANGLSPWVTYTSGAYKQFLHGNVPASVGSAIASAAIQAIKAPEVKGSGTIATIVRAALGKATGAANAYEQAHAPAASAAGGAAAPIAGLPAGVGTYQGVAVDKWIIPILQWAAGHGWGGSVNSGYRSPADQLIAARHYGLGHYGPAGPLGSNHVKANYPGGAVDVTDPAQLAAVLAHYPGHPNLVWGGPVIGDPVHFSATGHARGGLLPGFKQGGFTKMNPLATTTGNRIEALAIMNQIWRKGHPFYPGSGAALPPTQMAGEDQAFVGDVSDPNANRKDRYVLWPQWMTNMMLGIADPVSGQPGGRFAVNSALETLIHEWVHQYQSPNLLRNGQTWQIEGGAQAFAREFAPGILKAAGIKGFSVEPPGDDTYYGYVEKVRKQLGEAWIRRGQFTDSKHKYAKGGFLDQVKVLPPGTGHLYDRMTIGSIDSPGNSGGFNQAGKPYALGRIPNGPVAGPWWAEGDRRAKIGTSFGGKPGGQAARFTHGGRSTIAFKADTGDGNSYGDIYPTANSAINFTDNGAVRVEFLSDDHARKLLAGKGALALSKANAIKLPKPPKPKSLSGFTMTGAAGPRNKRGASMVYGPGGASPNSIFGRAGPLPFDTGDLNPISQALSRIFQLDGTDLSSTTGSGDAQKMWDLVNWYTQNAWVSGSFPAPNFSSAGSPADFVVSQDAAGNAIPPFISPHINQVVKQLGQAIGWQSSGVTDLQGALSLSRAVAKAVKVAIKRRQDMIRQIRKRIQDNLRKIRDRQRSMLAELKSKHPDHRKVNAWNQDVANLQQENLILGGARNSVGTGGELKQINDQLGAAASGSPLLVAEGGGSSASGLFSLLGNVQGWESQLGGVGGEIAQQKLALTGFQQNLFGLKAGANVALWDTVAGAAASGAAAASGTAASSGVSDNLASLLAQWQTNQALTAAVGKAEDRPLADSGSLPPFGGSFATGGMVPGMPGEARTIIAHGGEIVGTPGGGSHTFHVIVQDGAVDARRIKVIANGEVQKVNRQAVRSARRRMPGAAGVIRSPSIR